MTFGAGEAMEIYIDRRIVHADSPGEVIIGRCLPSYTRENTNIFTGVACSYLTKPTHPTFTIVVVCDPEIRHPWVITVIGGAALRPLKNVSRRRRRIIVEPLNDISMQWVGADETG